MPGENDSLLASPQDNDNFHTPRENITEKSRRRLERILDSTLAVLSPSPTKYGAIHSDDEPLSLTLGSDAIFADSDSDSNSSSNFIAIEFYPSDSEQVEMPNSVWGAIPLIRGRGDFRTRPSPRSTKNIIVDSLSTAATAKSPQRKPKKKPSHNFDFDEFEQRSTTAKLIKKLVSSTPSVVLASMLNLMLCVPFGSAFFPISWEPFPTSRAIGLKMWFFSTAISQLTFTFTSEFDCAMGMMMVENIPFMHAIAEIITSHQGTTMSALSTTIIAFGISTIVVGFTFFALGYFNLGSIVYLFPKHVIVGCIGGIGVFVVTTGLEVSTGLHFEATIASAEQFFDFAVAKLWLVVVILVVILRIMLLVMERKDKAFPLLSPLFFISITPMTFILCKVAGISAEEARSSTFFFPAPTPEELANSNNFEMFTLIDFKKCDWEAIRLCIPTIIGLTVFSIMHVPINIPSLSMSTGVESNMNKELIGHGISNLLSGLGGGCQNYMCYSNSVAYWKAGGGGKTSSLCITAMSLFFFFFGQSITAFVPRCMAGTLLVHVGLDLFLEGVYFSYNTGFDFLEYLTIWGIVITMSLGGMTFGLTVGVISAAIGFVVNASIHLNPIRGSMVATTLRSQRFRTRAAREILESEEHGRSKITIIQLQSHLYFDNLARFNDEIKRVVNEGITNRGIAGIILDFSLVNGIDR